MYYVDIDSNASSDRDNLPLVYSLTSIDIFEYLCKI